MSNILIMTGWGLSVYAPAAALVHKCICKGRANIKGVSQRHLAAELKAAVGKVDEIHILGIGLTKNLEEMASTLQELNDSGTKVHYISGFAFATPELRFASVTAREDGKLFEAIKDHYKKAIPEEDFEYFKRYDTEKTSKASDVGHYRLRAKAADWMHKTYREMGHYSEAIYDLANKVPASSFNSKPNIKSIIELYERWGMRELIGASKHIEETKKKIALAAKHEDANARVIITGPSGTGKETVAQQIHMRSKKRKDNAFLSFNCACTTPELLEARLFGYVRGAFTGADPQGKMGLFEAAEHGTLFLDEIAELSLEAQGQILRVLQDGIYQRVGDSTPRKVEDVRIITATNKNLGKLVKEGKFREDLYYRLNVIKIQMEPLSARVDDIAPIADHLWYKETHTHLSEAQLAALKTYNFPGNVRELENMLIRAKALEITDFKELVAEWRVENADISPSPEPTSASEVLDDVIHAHALRMYEKYRGQKTKKQIANEILKISEGTFNKYLH